MNNKQIEALGKIVGSLIHAMGMQAENMQRECIGHSMAYSDDSFFLEAANIDDAINELKKEDESE